MRMDSTTLVVKNPYTGASLQTLPLLRASDVDKVLERAVRVRNEHRLWLPLHERVMILERFAELLTEQREALVNLAIQEGGKPRKDTEMEMSRALDGVQCALAEMRRGHGHEVNMGYTRATAGHMAFTRRAPIGVVAAYSAFNHPINLWIHQVIPAVAVGTPIILKPAPATPLVAIRLSQLLYQAGLPEVWCQTITLSNELATELAKSPQLDALNFIGSARVGWHLRSLLAPGTRLTLEHGGVAPVVVDETADLDLALKLLVPGAYYHAGQVCVSVQRIYVHEHIARAFAVRMAEAASGLRVGDPQAEDTDVGPLISSQAVDRVAHWVDEAVQAGAELLTGGSPLPQHHSYAPTLLYGTPTHTRLMQEEVFGPVACVVPYRKLEEALKAANGLRTQFQAALFTQRLDHALLALEQLRAGAVMINDSTTFRADGMPFSGLGESGLGTGGIGYTMREYSYEKLCVLNYA
jgi:acyl-CoA reductase-like NAD-dependent aldehyde dehydrogenase